MDGQDILILEVVPQFSECGCKLLPIHDSQNSAAGGFGRLNVGSVNPPRGSDSRARTDGNLQNVEQHANVAEDLFCRLASASYIPRTGVVVSV